MNNNFKDGDWNCGKCNRHNFRSRQNCFKCFASKSSFSSNEDSKHNPTLFESIGAIRSEKPEQPVNQYEIGTISYKIKEANDQGYNAVYLEDGGSFEARQYFEKQGFHISRKRITKWCHHDGYDDCTCKPTKHNTWTIQWKKA